MRVAFSLVFALASVVPRVTARAFRQHISRSSTDVCAEVDADLEIPGFFPGAPSTNLGLLQICLCLSGIPGILDSSPLLITASALVGRSTVTGILTTMVNKAKGHKTCNYPDHYDPVCSEGNPCGFKCKNGFTPYPAKNPTDCVCSPPYKVCFGVCGNFKSCPSSHPWKRELERSKRALCDEGFTACGVYGWTGIASSQAWECIDTTSDLESCGGCMVPLGSGSPSGIDCTSIPGVADVSCSTGTCLVNRCLPGYTVSIDGSFCIRIGDSSRVESEWVAAAYGLEHVPLKRDT